MTNKINVGDIFSLGLAYRMGVGCVDHDELTNTRAIIIERAGHDNRCHVKTPEGRWVGEFWITTSRLLGETSARVGSDVDYVDLYTN